MSQQHQGDEAVDLRDVIAAAIRAEGTCAVARQLRVSRDTLLSYAGRFPCRRASVLLIEEQWRNARGAAATAA